MHDTKTPCDVRYSSTSLRPLVALLGALLAVGGRFHCVDPGRANLAAGPSGPSGLEAFVALVAQEFPAWAVTVEPLEAGGPGENRREPETWPWECAAADFAEMSWFRSSCDSCGKSH